MNETVKRFRAVIQQVPRRKVPQENESTSKQCFVYYFPIMCGFLQFIAGKQGGSYIWTLLVLIMFSAHTVLLLQVCADETVDRAGFLSVLSWSDGCS